MSCRIITLDEITVARMTETEYPDGTPFLSKNLRDLHDDIRRGRSLLEGCTYEESLDVVDMYYDDVARRRDKRAWLSESVSTVLKRTVLVVLGLVSSLASFVVLFKIFDSG